MAKPNFITFEEAELNIPILYEDRSVLAIDKPAGWMLAPDSWDETARNLQLALQSSMNAGDYWAHSRNLKYLRYVHRLDAETSGVILFAKSSGALRAYTELFETRQVDKRYLTVVHGTPLNPEWTCDLPLTAVPGAVGRMKAILPTDPEAKLFSTRDQDYTDDSEDDEDFEAESPPPGVRRHAVGPDRPLITPLEMIKDATTHFRVVAKTAKTTLVEAHPVTGRTHQIRVHLAASGHPVVGDPLYGIDTAAASKGRQKLALRARMLAYRDPFMKRPVRILAPMGDFLRDYGFDPNLVLVAPSKPRL